MSQLVKALGRNRDLPQLEAISVAADGAATTDYEHILAVVPDLSKIMPAGTAGQVPINAMKVRELYLTFEATLTGAAASVAYALKVRRAGSAPINTTATTAVAAPGAVAITPASMVGISLGSSIDVSGGVGTAETVIVDAVTATTFTATFANTHSGTYNLVSTPIASVTFGVGTNATAWVPFLVKPLVGPNNVLQAGDVLTLARTHTSTGQTAGAMLCAVDWDCA